MRPLTMASVLLAAMLASLACRADVVYDNTGGGLGGSIGQIGSLGPCCGPHPSQALGLLFTPSASGPLASVTVGLPYVYSTTGGGAGAPYEVSVYANDAGRLGRLVESLGGFSTIPVGSAGPPFAFTTAASIAHPALDSALSYWLVLSAPINTQLVWQGVQGAPDVPGVQFFTNTFMPVYFTGPQGALIVETMSAVPLPATGLLMLLGMGAGATLLGGGRRRIEPRRRSREDWTPALRGIHP